MDLLLESSDQASFPPIRFLLLIHHHLPRRGRSKLLEVVIVMLRLQIGVMIKGILTFSFQISTWGERFSSLHTFGFCFLTGYDGVLCQMLHFFSDFSSCLFPSDLYYPRSAFFISSNSKIHFYVLPLTLMLLFPCITLI